MLLSTRHKGNQTRCVDGVIPYTLYHIPYTLYHILLYLSLWDLLSSEEDQISLTFTGWKFTPLNVISFKPTLDEIPAVELVPV